MVIIVESCVVWMLHVSDDQIVIIMHCTEMHSSVICNVSTFTSTGTASGYNDICNKYVSTAAR